MITHAAAVIGIKNLTCVLAEVESQFAHRKVTFKRGKDVRNGFEMLHEIGR